MKENRCYLIDYKTMHSQKIEEVGETNFFMSRSAHQWQSKQGKEGGEGGREG